MSATTSPADRAQPGPDHSHSSGGRALVGGIWTAASTLSPYVYTLLTSIVAARVLGPDDMGRQSFIAFVVMTVQQVSTQGIGYSIVRYTGDLVGQGRQNRIRSLVRFGWLLAVPVSILAAAVLLLVAVGGADPRGAWAFGALAVLAGGLNQVPVRVLIGIQRWRSQSVVLLVTGAVSVVATIVVLAIGWGITGMLAVTAASALGILVWSFRLMQRCLAALPRPSLPLGAMRRDVLLFALGNYGPFVLTFIVAQRSEFFFLERSSSDAQIALYSIAFAFLLALLAVPTGVRMVVIPSVATLIGAGDLERVRRGFSRLVRLSILVTVPVTAGALALGPTLLSLVYGSQYSGAGDVLLILLLPLPLVPLASAGAALVIGFGRVKVPTLVSGIAAAVDIIAAVLLVPRYGAIGAATANSLAATASAVTVLPYCRSLVGDIDISVRHVVRIVLASAVAGATARLVLVDFGTGLASFIAATVVGIVGFAFLAVVFKVVPAADGEWLAGVARERGARSVERAVRALAG
jgi:O-antigen/teichoic acid export membrane protein